MAISSVFGDKSGVRFPLVWLVAIATMVLFVCSSLRHALFQSTAFDLGIFDNAIYLISQGQEPIVSFRGLHILGDHAAWILYPLGLLYAVVPDVHWLFAVQGLSLALGAIMPFIQNKRPFSCPGIKTLH